MSLHRKIKGQTATTAQLGQVAKAIKLYYELLNEMGIPYQAPHPTPPASTYEQQ